MIVFIGILAFGLLYAWKKGVLRWRSEMADDKQMIEVYEVHDDPQMGVEGTRDAAFRHHVKSLEPTTFDSSQGKAAYRTLLPGIMQMPADYLIAVGEQVLAVAADFGLPAARSR